MNRVIAVLFVLLAILVLAGITRLSVSRTRRPVWLSPSRGWLIWIMGGLLTPLFIKPLATPAGGKNA